MATIRELCSDTQNESHQANQKQFRKIIDYNYYLFGKYPKLCAQRQSTNIHFGTMGPIKYYVD